MASRLHGRDGLSLCAQHLEETGPRSQWGAMRWVGDPWFRVLTRSTRCDLSGAGWPGAAAQSPGGRWGRLRKAARAVPTCGVGAASRALGVSDATGQKGRRIGRRGGPHRPRRTGGENEV
jgi:hypothetical protein